LQELSIQVLETLAGQMDWAGRNIIYNLNFVPEDKLDWKPQPTANSVLEIVNHSVSVISRITARLQGGNPPAHFEPATTRAEAKAAIGQCTRDYIAVLHELTPDDLNRKVQMPWGEVPLANAAMVAVVDTINHHGQITYIQTLLGDTESHLQM
jgi:uncharacterized damage-inducible protein DinB